MLLLLQPPLLLAHLLVAEGFSSVEEVAYVAVEEMISIEGFDEELAAELHNRAVAYLDELAKQHEEERRSLGVSDEVAAVPGLNGAMLVVLGQNGIKALDDLADLAGYELIDGSDGVLREFELTQEEADAIIMAARAHWFEDDEQTDAEQTDAEQTDAEQTAADGADTGDTGDAEADREEVTPAS